MVSLLESSIRKTVAQAFKGRLLTGTLRRETSTKVDTHGEPVNVEITLHTFNGIRDNFNASYAVRAGIPITDVRILIIAGSLDTDARKDDKILIRGQWHQVRRILEIDPANATYVLQCFEIPVPIAQTVEVEMLWDDNDTIAWDDGELMAWDS